jgi:hypothetical protein
MFKDVVGNDSAMPLKLTGRPQGRARRLQIVYKCALRNFAISLGLLRSLYSQGRMKVIGGFFQKADHARLHKLFEFVRFGASTLDHHGRF